MEPELQPVRIAFTPYNLLNVDSFDVDPVRKELILRQDEETFITSLASTSSVTKVSNSNIAVPRYRGKDKPVMLCDLPPKAWSFKTLIRRSPNNQLCLCKLKKGGVDISTIPLGIGGDPKNLVCPLSTKEKSLKKSSRNIIKFGFLTNTICFLVTRDRFVVFEVNRGVMGRGERQADVASKLSVTLVGVKTLDEAFGCVIVDSTRVDSPCPPLGVTVFIVFEKGQGRPTLRAVTVVLPSTQSPAYVEPSVSEVASIFPITIADPKTSLFVAKEKEGEKEEPVWLSPTALRKIRTQKDKGEGVSNKETDTTTTVTSPGQSSEKSRHSRRHTSTNMTTGNFKSAWQPQCCASFCEGLPVLAVVGRRDSKGHETMSDRHSKKGKESLHDNIYILNPLGRTPNGNTEILLTIATEKLGFSSVSLHFADGLLMVLDKVTGRYNLFDVAHSICTMRKTAYEAAVGYVGRTTTLPNRFGDLLTSSVPNGAQGIGTGRQSRRLKHGQLDGGVDVEGKKEKSDVDANIIKPLFQSPLPLGPFCLSPSAVVLPGGSSPSQLLSTQLAQMESSASTIASGPRLPKGGLTSAYQNNRRLSGLFLSMSDGTERQSSTERERDGSVLHFSEAPDDTLHLLPMFPIDGGSIDPSGLLELENGLVAFVAKQDNSTTPGEPYVFLGIGFLDLDPAAVANQAFGPFSNVGCTTGDGNIQKGTDVFERGGICERVQRLTSFALCRSAVYKSQFLDIIMDSLREIACCPPPPPESVDATVSEPTKEDKEKGGKTKKSQIAPMTLYLLAKRNFFKGVMGKLVGRYAERVRETIANRSLVDTRRIANIIATSNPTDTLASLSAKPTCSSSQRKALDCVGMLMTAAGLPGVPKSPPPATTIFDACLRQYLSLRNDGCFQLSPSVVDEADGTSPGDTISMGYRRLSPVASSTAHGFQPCQTPSLLSPVASEKVGPSCLAGTSTSTAETDSVTNNASGVLKTPPRLPTDNLNPSTPTLTDIASTCSPCSPYSPHFLALLSPSRQGNSLAAVPSPPGLAVPSAPNRISSALVEYMLGSSLFDLRQSRTFTTLFPPSVLYKVTVTQSDILKTIIKASSNAKESKAVFLWLELCLVECLLENNIDLTLGLTSHLTECLLGPADDASHFGALQLLTSGAFPNTYEISLKLFTHGTVSSAPIRPVGLAGLEKTTILEQRWITNRKLCNGDGASELLVEPLSSRRRQKTNMALLPLVRLDEVTEMREGGSAERHRDKAKGKRDRTSDFVVSVINNIITTDPLLALRLVGDSCHSIPTRDWMRYADNTGDWRVFVRIFERIAPNRILTNLSTSSLLSAAISGSRGHRGPRGARYTQAGLPQPHIHVQESTDHQPSSGAHTATTTTTLDKEGSAPQTKSQEATDILKAKGFGDEESDKEEQKEMKEMKEGSEQEDNHTTQTAAVYESVDNADKNGDENEVGDEEALSPVCLRAEVRGKTSSSNSTRSSELTGKKCEQTDHECSTTQQLSTGLQPSVSTHAMELREDPSMAEGSTTWAGGAASVASGSSGMRDSARYIQLYALWRFPFASETSLLPVIEHCTQRDRDGKLWGLTDVADIKKNFLSGLIDLNTRFML